MKKSWIVSLALAVLVGGASGCEQSGGSKTNIKGIVPPSDSLNGCFAYLFKDGVNLDSVKIENDAFAFATRPADTLSVYGVVLAAAGESWVASCFIVEYRSMSVVPEAGDILLDFVDMEVKGGAINQAMLSYNKSVREIEDKIYNLSYDLPGEEFESKRDSLQGVYEDSITRMTEKAFRANSGNGFGGDLLVKLLGSSNLTAERLAELRAIASPALFEKEGVKELVEGPIKREKARELTSVGAPFIDVKGTTSQGSAVSLSDYAGKGHYTLVDFWASWCGPCKRSMPELKEIYKEFHPKGLEIVGLVVWDWDSAHKEAMAELELPWPQIINEREATELYGIQGIPHLILIDPSGKIVARDVHGKEEISKLLREEMAKNGGKL